MEISSKTLGQNIPFYLSLCDCNNYYYSIEFALDRLYFTSTLEL